MYWVTGCVPAHGLAIPGGRLRAGPVYRAMLFLAILLSVRSRPAWLARAVTLVPDPVTHKIRAVTAMHHRPHRQTTLSLSNQSRSSAGQQHRAVCRFGVQMTRDHRAMVQRLTCDRGIRRTRVESDERAVPQHRMDDHHGVL